MNLTHAYSKYIEDAYTNSDNTGDDADVPPVPVLLPYWGLLIVTKLLELVVAKLFKIVLLL